jgi:hypothetical protein
LDLLPREARSESRRSNGLLALGETGAGDLIRQRIRRGRAEFRASPKRSRLAEASGAARVAAASQISDFQWREFDGGEMAHGTVMR